MENIRIDLADVILQDFGDGKGKIIISDDDWGYNFSYYWGAMGKDKSLIDFLLSLNYDYFSSKLGPAARGPIDVKKTMANVRKEIREELPWYQYLEFQKDLREELNKFQGEIYDDRDFVEQMSNFIYRLNFYLIEDNDYLSRERQRVESIMKAIFECEPWRYLVYGEHQEKKYLRDFLPKLKKALNEYKNLQRSEVQDR